MTIRPFKIDTMSQNAVRSLIHDLRASTTAFQMLIESLEGQGSSPQCARTQKKIQQLYLHADLNRRAVETLIDSYIVPNRSGHESPR